MLKDLRKNFITGILILTPVTIIIWLCIFLINILGGVRNILPDSISDSSNYFIRASSSVLVLLLIFIFIVAAGWLSRKIIGKQLLSFMEETIAKIPILRTAYKAIKQLIDVFSGKNQQFQAVCIIEFPRKGLHSYGFITGETTFEGKKHYHVFVPTTPNPTSGFTVLAEQSEVTRVNITVEEAFKIIISMGVLSTNKGDLQKLV
jgi:uncharacterized membrane protein